MREGRVTQAGPGVTNSAAIGPRLLVGVQGLCVSPPIVTHTYIQYRVEEKLSYSRRSFCKLAKQGQYTRINGLYNNCQIG